MEPAGEVATGIIRGQPLHIRDSLRYTADQIFHEYRENARHQEAIPYHGLNGRV